MDPKKRGFARFTALLLCGLLLCGTLSGCSGRGQEYEDEPDEALPGEAVEHTMTVGETELRLAVGESLTVAVETDLPTTKLRLIPADKEIAAAKGLTLIGRKVGQTEVVLRGNGAESVTLHLTVYRKGEEVAFGDEAENARLYRAMQEEVGRFLAELDGAKNLSVTAHAGQNGENKDDRIAYREDPLFAEWIADGEARYLYEEAPGEVYLYERAGEEVVRQGYDGTAEEATAWIAGQIDGYRLTEENFAFPFPAARGYAACSDGGYLFRSYLEDTVSEEELSALEESYKSVGADTEPIRKSVIETKISVTEDAATGAKTLIYESETHYYIPLSLREIYVHTESRLEVTLGGFPAPDPTLFGAETKE